MACGCAHAGAEEVQDRVAVTPETVVSTTATTITIRGMARTRWGLRMRSRMTSRKQTRRTTIPTKGQGQPSAPGQGIAQHRQRTTTGSSRLSCHLPSRAPANPPAGDSLVLSQQSSVPALHLCPASGSTATELGSSSARCSTTSAPCVLPCPLCTVRVRLVKTVCAVRRLLRADGDQLALESIVTEPGLYQVYAPPRTNKSTSIAATLGLCRLKVVRGRRRPHQPSFSQLD